MGLHVIVLSNGYDLPEVYGTFKTYQDALDFAHENLERLDVPFDIYPLKAPEVVRFEYPAK